jgi:transketolase N-terminal domain/subunit
VADDGLGVGVGVGAGVGVGGRAARSDSRVFFGEAAEGLSLES